MVTRAQLKRLTSRIERLGASLNPLSARGVPVYEGENEQVALAAYEKELGKIPPGTPIEFNRWNRKREDSKASGLHLYACMNSEQLGAVIKRVQETPDLRHYIGKRRRSDDRSPHIKPDGTHQPRGSESVEDKD